MQIIIYSKNRQYQLDACLHSIYTYVKNYYSTNIIYSGKYDVIKNEHKHVRFIKETNLLEQTKLLLSQDKYTLFVVDDTLFYRDIDVDNLLMYFTDDVLGISLRLGLNTVYCYMHNCKQIIPMMQYITPQILKFDWTKQKHDFGYPFEIASSVYRSEDILKVLNKFRSLTPTTIESRLNRSRDYSKPNLICLKKSIAFSCPANIVTGKNKCGNKYSAQKLNSLFNQGIRFDINKLKDLKITSPHQEIDLC